jgi:hypothetical protein
MQLGKNVVPVLAVLILVPLLLTLVLYFSVTNREASLRNQFTAQLDANKNQYDEMWKVIASDAEVTDKYKDSFREVWAGIVAGQRNDRASVLAWISAINPKFSDRLFLKLMGTINSQRHQFTLAQNKLRDIKREHDNLRTRVPSSWIVGNVPALDYVAVTSEKTVEAFQTRQDNNPKVFK